MQLIRGFYNFKKSMARSVVTLGNFDGVHLGHQRLLRELKQQGEALQAATVVVVFEPQPKEYFAKCQLVPRLMRLSEKYLALKNLNIDYLYCLRFNDFLAGLSATEFVEKILLQQLAMRAVIVGYDFRFGAARGGDFNLLRQLGQLKNFTAIEVPPVYIENEVVSSTRVREALNQGNMSLVGALLGRSFSLWGKVTYGEQRGRDLGFPTANINLHRQLVPVNGVFIVRAKLAGKIYNGVANVGMRPTFDGQRVLLEVHLFDFNQMIYGCTMEVEFLHKLREERRFESFAELLAQIKKDVSDARNYFVLNMN